MSHTNSTTNYSLPQFITTDKPAWLTDINNAFLAIDTGMNNAQTKADSAQNDATQALTDASNAATAAATADAKGAGAVASLADVFNAAAIYDVGAIVTYNNLLYVCEVAIITPGPWTGAANWSRVNVEDLIDAVNNSIESATTLGIGDTVQIRYHTAAAIVQSGTTVRFFISTPKTIKPTVTGATISGTTFNLYPSNAGSEQISLTDGTWSFNIRNDGILCTLTLDNAINITNGCTAYFASATLITLT